MEMHFLKKVALKILEIPKENWPNLWILLPNRRAQLYLQKHLSQLVKENFWAPNFISINDFVFQYSKLQNIEKLELVKEFYNIHKEIEGQKAQSVDQFLTWVEILLVDFNEIDLYLKDPQEVFSYLHDTKRLNQWHIDGSLPSAMEIEYLKFFEHLPLYHQKLSERLLNKGKAYQGLAYSYLATTKEVDFENISQVMVVGFNALTPSEQLIFSRLKATFTFQYLWDIDPYYFENNQHEAGYFLRKNLLNTPHEEVSFIDNQILNSNCKLHVYSSNGNSSQIRFANQLLAQWADEKEFDPSECAVILLDESLTLAFLKHIPEKIDKYNLSISYGLKNHYSYQLVLSIIQLYQQNYFDGPNEPFTLHHSSFIRFLNLPLIRDYLGIIAYKLEVHIKYNNQSQFAISKEQYPFDEPELHDPRLKSLILLLIPDQNDVSSILDVILRVIEEINVEQNEQNDSAFILHIHHIVKTLKLQLQSFDRIEKVLTLRKWVVYAMNQNPVPFSGEPLTGIQIMGLLETRALDFKKLIFIGANEGFFPKSTTYQSFLPMDLRIDFQLPLPNQNDAITSYYFYRLLQRTDEVHVIYNNTGDSMGSAELSRYIGQIKEELLPLNPNIRYQELEISNPENPKTNTLEIRISKDDEILSIIENYLTNFGLSASSLNDYKKCSLQFYFKKIASIKVQDTVEEELGINSLGSLIHEALEEFFIPYLTNNKSVTSIDFEQSSKKILTLFEQKLNSKYKNTNLEEGINHINLSLNRRYLNYFIHSQLEELKSSHDLRIEGLEQKLEAELLVQSNANQQLRVLFKGSADRIDRLDQQLRIIDYKSGKFDVKDITLSNKSKNLMETIFNADKEKAFQLFLYAWMYSKISTKDFPVVVGINSLKLKARFFPLTINDQELIDMDLLLEFEEQLIHLIQEILNPEVEFEQCTNTMICKNCDYSTICQRNE